ncbi:cytochrome P450 [Haliangium ochraceum]|uniref:Cytochrome P450 n=1 Tax=Haliangium ochraceum (strain DSM 14365 / JCM 11303 / SMP-2) TaxID=502025 RepID=D0LZJ2_HALO1|nr:cytochrome P450 [Haliangium ochraceum]ACY17971.1 cytochrome P450 [Haliangium ochraceum DSM 14365]
MSTLPPGPSGKLRPTYRLLTKPRTAIPAWSARYGDPFTLKSLTGHVVVTGNPEGNRAIFSADPDTFDTFAANALEPFVGQYSMLLLSGEVHRRHRKLLMPPFHGERMRAYAAVMAEVARRKLREAGAGPVRAIEVAQEISIDVIVRAIFGIHDDDRAAELCDAVRRAMGALHPALAFMPFLQRRFGGIGPYARMRRYLDYSDSLVAEQMKRARTQPGDDILSLMLAARDDEGQPMSEVEILDELRTLVFAGHETTALLLAWGIDFIHRHPAVLKRLLAEIDQVDDSADDAAERYAQLPYLDAVCKETLRLQPPVLEVLRTLRVPFELCGYTVPPGMGVAASVQLTHSRPDLYPEPEAFRPERFLERKFSPFEYFPFGGGNRRCIGAAFSSFEAKVVLATLLANWQVRLLDPEPPVPVRASVVITPKGGVPIELTSRQRPN